jgi:hypothetical protein
MYAPCVGIDFIAEFALGASFAGPERLCAQLAAEPSGLRETVERYRDRWLVKEWAVQACHGHPAFPQILGPGGFSLTLSPVVANLFHVMRFSTFASDADERALLRRSCSVVAGLVGSSRALVMPELTPTGFFEGLDLTAIEARLRHEIGAPATTWEELRASSQYGPGSWYVEVFADLR